MMLTSAGLAHNFSRVQEVQRIDFDDESQDNYYGDRKRPNSSRILLYTAVYGRNTGATQTGQIRTKSGRLRPGLLHLGMMADLKEVLNLRFSILDVICFFLYQ